MNKYGFLKVAVAVPQVKVADVKENTRRIVEMSENAARQGAEVVVFPELSLTGYTCGDLVMQPTLLSQVEASLDTLRLTSHHFQQVIIVGAPLRHGSSLYDCGVVIAQGRILGIVPKQWIAHHDGASEKRWFSSGANLRGETIWIKDQEVPFGGDLLFSINGVKAGIEIGSDLQAVVPPSSEMSLGGAKLIFNLAATPTGAGHYEYVREAVVSQSARTQSAYIYASAGNGESTTNAVYAGEGLVVEDGVVLAETQRFKIGAELILSDIDIDRLDFARLHNSMFSTNRAAYRTQHVLLRESLNEALDRQIDPMPFIPSKETREMRCEEIFSTQAHGLAQRITHTHSRTAIVGVSGGLDSTLALLVMVEAFDLLGKDRKQIIGVTMPGFGTTGRTYDNALKMMQAMGITVREIPIRKACEQHFADIGLDPKDRSAAFENGQARERTQILMDVANMEGGLVVGTGDLSELALGWCTYNGDQMSMYGVNGTVPKTLVRELVTWRSEKEENEELRKTLIDVVETPVSPELLPADDKGNIAQKTEDLVGPYELHDFFLYHFLRSGASPRKILFMAEQAFAGVYDRTTILKWLKTFFRRFFSQQFKRSAMPDGARTGSISLSPRGDWSMPSDALASVWIDELNTL